MSVFLYAPEDFHNLCLLARTLEAFAHTACYVFDPAHLVRERYGKVRTRELRAVSAGAFQKITWQKVEEPARLLGEHPGRSVATVIEPAAPSLDSHRFAPSDLLVFGPEARGLPPEIVALCTLRVTIPLPGRTQSLNLSVALGIALFERQRQLDA